jgi:hypothetical protein
MNCVITWGRAQEVSNPRYWTFIHGENTHAVVENTNPCFLVGERDVHAPEVVYAHADAPHAPMMEVEALLVLTRQRRIARNVCENIDPYHPRQTHSAAISTLPLPRPCAAPHPSALPPQWQSLAHTYGACVHVVEHVAEQAVRDADRSAR